MTLAACRCEQHPKEFQGVGRGGEGGGGEGGNAGADPGIGIWTHGLDCLDKLGVLRRLESEGRCVARPLVCLFRI